MGAVCGLIKSLSWGEVLPFSFVRVVFNLAVLCHHHRPLGDRSRVKEANGGRGAAPVGGEVREGRDRRS